MTRFESPVAATATVAPAALVAPRDVRDAVLAAVERRCDDIAGLTARLVREATVVGHEAGGQAVLADRLERAGFAVTRVEPDARLDGARPGGGFAPLPYEGRSCVVGSVAGTGGGRSLHLSGHIDVVPIEAEHRWTHAPWGGEQANGRIFGRGAGDMKAGLAAYLVAAETLLERCGPPAGDLIFSSVIEEETSGNGMRAVLRHGFDADATLIGEPTGLRLNHGGCGLVFAEVTLEADGGHPAFVDNARLSDRFATLLSELRVLERELNEHALARDELSAYPWPCPLNVGRIASGVWDASVPAELTCGLRIGFGFGLTPDEVHARVREVVARAVPGAAIRFHGHRAAPYRHPIDDALATALAAAHGTVNEFPALAGIATWTTDARHVARPALCYGPAAGRLHAVDEWVDVESMRRTAAVVAAFMLEWSYRH